MKRRNIKIDGLRVGNFVFHRELLHIKVSDINSTASHRISLLTPKGQFVDMAVKQEHKEWLAAYAAVMYNVLCCVPDAEYLDAINKAAVACAERHKDLYGIKDEVDPVEDAQTLADVVNAQNAEEEVKEVLKKEMSDEGKD